MRTAGVASVVTLAKATVVNTKASASMNSVLNVIRGRIVDLILKAPAIVETVEGEWVSA
jgi:hypothetical protein